MATIEKLRAQAAQHAKQIEAVQWLSVNDLAARWGISPGSVRKIARDALPYLLFGESNQRRYDPRDVEQYEAEQKHPTENDSGEADA